MFLSRRDAEDAVRGRDGYEFDGQRIRVEFPHGGRGGGRHGGGGGGGGGGSGGFGGGGGGGGGGFGRGPPPRRSEYRVLVSGLPPTGSWQDLKDHMRDAGDVQFTDVFKDGTGIVEFSRYDDMKYAIKHLDDSKFRSHEVCKSEKNGRFIALVKYLFNTYFTVVFAGRSCFYSCQTGQCWPWPRWWITQSQPFLFKKQISKEEVPFSKSTAIILPKEIQVSFSFSQEEKITLSKTLQITLPLPLIGPEACLLLCCFSFPLLL